MTSDVKLDRAKLKRDIAKSPKEFSQDLFDSNDSRARTRVLTYLRENTGLHVVENLDKYGPDLVAFRGFQPSYYIEVEVKHVWKDPTKFPYDTVQLPQRKEKYSKLKLPVQFWLLNTTLEAAIIIEGSELSKVSPVEVRNKYISEGEMFFQIPTSDCKVVNLLEIPHEIK